MQQATLQLGNLKLENITQRTLGLLGGKGTGKTTLMKMINYQLSQDHPQLQLYIFDPLNVINIEGFNRVTVPRTSKDKGAALAKVLNKTTDHHLIIALKDMVQEEQAEFMNSLFGEWKVHDALISVDEMHDFCPEGGQHGTYCIELERAVRHWRNKNDGFIFATQRPAKLNKNILELADAMNINRLTGNNDRQAAEGYLKGAMTKEEAQAILGNLQHMGFLESYFMDFRTPGKNQGKTVFDQADKFTIPKDKIPHALQTDTYLGEGAGQKIHNFSRKSGETAINTASKLA